MNRDSFLSSTLSGRAAMSAVLGLALLWPLGCKDESPCDDGQVSIGTACFAKEAPGAGGESSEPPAGAAGAAPSGNPDATFRTPCQKDEDCGGDAPVCATDPLFYCSQLECLEGEANAGACPSDWQCIKLDEQTPSACVDLSGF